jgi:hypothetical protein
MSKPQGLMRLEGLGELIRIFHLSGYRTRELLVYSPVPEPLRYRVQPRSK